MKHLVFDANAIFDILLQRGQHETLNRLIDETGSLNVKLWISSSILGAVSYFLEGENEQAVTDRSDTGRWRMRLSSLLERVQVLSSFGFEQQEAVENAENLADAQTALAARHLHGDKRIVTIRKAFDTLGIIETVSPLEALEWIRQESPDEPVAFIDLKAQQDAIRPRLEKNIHSVLSHGRYILGPEVKELEERLCEFTGARHCIGVSSGTDALLMPLMAWGIGPGDAVFTTPFTFIATAEVIRLLGATPIFVDIDPKTFNIDPENLKLAIQAVKNNDPAIHPLPKLSPHNSILSPKAVIPVDLFGLPADYDSIMAIAEEHGLKVLSDSAQGFGSEYKGQRSGTLGHVTATSFFPAKPLGGYGDGGAIFTNDDDLAVELESIRVHGKGRDKYDNVRIGLNARLDALQAAILLAKLDIFPDELKRKQQLADEYTKIVRERESGLTPPFVPEGHKSAWAQYSILAGDSKHRLRIQAKLKDAGIPSMVYYPKPLHMQTAFSNLGYKAVDFPVSEKSSERIFSLPMHGYMDTREIGRIAGMLCG